MKFVLLCAVPVFGLLSWSGSEIAHAKGTMGPSAKRAATLKQSPPNNYVRHYLPEDRYKLGTAWKFVTTELDTYYHRPNCPNMLRQGAARVIGFENVREAEEAGYRPDGTCAHAGFASSGYYGTGGGNNLAATGRIVLADGASTLVVPKGWKRTSSIKTAARGVVSSRDIFSSARGGRVEIHQSDMSALYKNSSIPELANVDLGKVFTPAGIKKAQENRDQRLQQTGNTNLMNIFQRMQAGNKYGPATVGGIKGVSLTSPRRAGSATRVVAVGKGSKFLALMDFSARGTSVNAFLRAVKPVF